MARRFVCPPDPVWRRVHGAICALGGLAVVVALVMQLLALGEARLAGWGLAALLMATGAGVAIVAGVVAAVALVALVALVAAAAVVRGDRRRRRLSPQSQTHLLRWDTQQWWWRVLPARSGPVSQAVDRKSEALGAPLAVTPRVLLDLEHWMLVRLVPTDASGGLWCFWRHRLLAVSRRHHGRHWSLLRIHLFMARE